MAQISSELGFFQSKQWVDSLPTSMALHDLDERERGDWLGQNQALIQKRLNDLIMTGTTFSVYVHFLLIL